MKIFFKPTFVRQYNALEKDLQEEVLEKIELFREKKNYKQLKAHKLHGRLTGRHSFSVNYKIRIVFSYLNKQEIVLLTVGDHGIYK